MEPDRIGRYQIQRRIGRGGMGWVFQAHDPRLDRLVAIKLLKDDLCEDEQLRERFLREARAAARLRHPNIIVVFDVDEDRHRPFIAMEYIAGETLADVLRRRPLLPLVRRLSLMEDLCAGLAHAHAAGIVHRDIKPTNIMIDGDGVLKILDFGIARLADAGLTQDGMILGSINYMSPEQVSGQGVDQRTDVFAVGAVLYETIALQQAFPGDVEGGVFHNILNEGALPLEQRVPDVDPDLARIVHRALEREPAQRYEDTNVLRRALARVRRRLLDAASDAAAETPIDSTVVAPPRSPARRPDSDPLRRLDPRRATELRRQQVAEHLAASEAALARGDHQAALQHAERAAAVDPDHRQAYDQIDKVRLGIDAIEIRQLLAEARQAVSDGRLEDASVVVERAVSQIPDLPAAAPLRVEAHRLHVDVAASRGREQHIEAFLGQARSAFEQGGYETALRAVYEVLALDPDRPEARELEQLAHARLQEKRRRKLFGRMRDRASSRRYVTAITAIAVLVSIAAGVMLLESRTATVTPPITGVTRADGQHEPPGAQERERPDPPDPPPSPQPQVALPEPTPPPDARPRATRDTLDTAFEGHRQRARELVSQGRDVEALEAIRSALALRPGDPEMRGALDSMGGRARQAVQRVKQDALRAGAAARAAETYRTALDAESAAARERLAGRMADAVLHWWQARDHFAAAADQARNQTPAPTSTAPASPDVGAVPDENPPGTSGRPAAQPASPPEGETRDPTSPASIAQERAAVVAMLRAYEAAWEKLDVEALRRLQVFSRAELAAVQQSIEAAREYRITINVRDVAVGRDGRVARVSAQVERIFIPRNTGRRQRDSSRTTFVLEKRGDTWLIVAMQ